MPAYAKILNDGGEVWLSGFYENDIAHLIEKAESVGLQHVITKKRGEWRWIKLKK
jgi:ribosomal protein L11 methyltransferase